MSANNLIREKLALPINDFFSGTSISSDMKFLMKSQWWSESQIMDFQNDRLRKLINHAYNNVTYYKEIFDLNGINPRDIRTIEDLKKVPVLTKADIRKNIFNGKIIARNIPRSSFLFGSSSGSTGEPLQYYVTKDSHSFAYASALRAWYWMSYRLGDKYVKISQNPRTRRIKRIQDRVNRCLYLYSQQLIEENFKIIIEEINKYKPDFIRGYPDPLLFLANYMGKLNYPIIPPKAINTTGNILFGQNRKKIEEIFGCRVFDSYSCEGGANVSECGEQGYYHSTSEYAISEILSSGKEVGLGERGRLFTTDLHNYAVPFIRYDTQDYLTKAKEKCSCGRGLPTIASIDGRDSDILVTPKGKYLIVHNFTGYFEWLDTVDQFQVRQVLPDKIDILLKTNDRFDSGVYNQILSYWEKYIGEGVKIELNLVDEIPLASSGKRRFLIRDSNIKLF